MKNLLVVFATLLTFVAPTTNAGVVTSAQVIEQQRFELNKQQILAMVDSKDVQQKLVALGVTSEDAKNRINNLTPTEVMQLNKQMNNAPAGSGIIGIVVTVFVVVAVLDLLGITDAYSFIEPI
ncbi:PA2779 family protein [Colwelliaceae bacterium 6471]